MLGQAAASVPLGCAGRQPGLSPNRTAEHLAGLPHLRAIAGALAEAFAGVVKAEEGPWTPHITCAKISLMRRNGMGNEAGAAGIPQGALQHLMDVDAGAWCARKHCTCTDARAGAAPLCACCAQERLWCTRCCCATGARSRLMVSTKS